MGRIPTLFPTERHWTLTARLWMPLSMRSLEGAVMWAAWTHCLNHSTLGTIWGELYSFGTQKSYFLSFRDLGKMLAKANLPRASSHGNMFVCDTSSMTGMGSLTSPLSPNHQHRPDLSLSSQPSSFSKSDICLERPPPPQTLATFLENSSPSPSRQVRDWHYNKVSNGIRGMDLSRNGLTEECPIKYFGSSIVFVYSQISLTL